MYEIVYHPKLTVIIYVGHYALAKRYKHDQMKVRKNPERGGGGGVEERQNSIIINTVQTIRCAQLSLSLSLSFSLLLSLCLSFSLSLAL